MYGATPSNNELSIDGQKFKVLSGENSGSPSWYVAGTDDSGGSATARGTFSYPEFTPPSFDYQGFNAPAPFDYPDYVGPNAETVQNDPGYEFGRREGLRALTNRASADGSLRSGAYDKGLMEYGTGLANQQFGVVDARQRQTWQGNRGNQADIYDRNYRNSITQNMFDYNREADEFNRSMATYGTNQGNAMAVQGINAGDQNTRWNQLLSLYDISTRNLPTYQPTTTNPAQFGFGG